MKQNIWLSLFALSLLIFLPTKQIFALETSKLGWQDTENNSAALMAERVNEHRQEAGLPPYTSNLALLQAAQKIADHMAATEFISHHDGDGANPNQRAERFGYADHVTEIIYGGFGGADAAWEWWMTNELHQGLILSQEYYELGVGMAVGVDSGRLYWAIVFGTGQPLAEEPQVMATSPSNLTKLPTTATTAVPSPSPTADQTPTEVAAILAGETPVRPEENDIITIAEMASAEEQIDLTMTPAGISSQTGTSQDTWLIIAAAATILFGILLFYFPRVGWPR